MVKKTKKEPKSSKEIKKFSFDEMITETIKKEKKARKFVEKTGKCIICKKNSVIPGNLECPSCQKELKANLNELHKMGGFMAFNIHPRQKGDKNER